MFSAAPMVPAPKKPIAKPRFCGGKKRAQYGVPTANDAPTTPSNRPIASNCQYCVAWLTRYTGTAATSNNAVMTMRPPKRSVQIPNGSRITAPSSTGVAVRRPNSVLLSPSVALIGIPITPNIIQTAKQTMKANVLANSAT